MFPLSTVPMPVPPPCDSNRACRLAIYDMDKTITRRATYNYFLWHMMWSRTPWRVVLTPALLLALALYGVGIWDRSRLKSFSQSVLIGRKVHRAEIARHLERHAELVLGRNIYPEARARIEAERAQGFTLILATASYRLYVEAIAAKLGFDHVIATELETDEAGRIRSRILGENCYDYAKLARVQQWMEGEGLARDTCFIRGYSDHYSDAPLLGFADEGYAVNAHKKLATLAEDRGWSVIDWRYKNI